MADYDVSDSERDEAYTDARPQESSDPTISPDGHLIDVVQKASEDSFPASDPPGWIFNDAEDGLEDKIG